MKYILQWVLDLLDGEIKINWKPDVNKLLTCMLLKKRKMQQYTTILEDFCFLLSLK